METQGKQEFIEIRCSVCEGWLRSAIDGKNDDFYRDVLKCCSCARMFKIENGKLRPYTGRGR